MNKLSIVTISAAIAVAFGGPAIATAAMSKGDYKAAQSGIAGDYKSAKEGCAKLTSNAKDVCMAEARGKEKVAKAELDARNKPGVKADYAVGVAKAEADYAVARERCDDKAGKDKVACLKQAKSAEDRAKAEAKGQLKTSAAKTQPASPAPARQTPGAFVDDTVITAKVKAAVLEEPSLKSAEINVTTLKGTVQLTGFVRSRANIDKAVEVAKGVKGVTSVKNDMVLKGTQ